MKILLSLIFGLYVLSACGQKAVVYKYESFLDSVINTGMRKEGIPGTGIVIVQNGKIVFLKGYGFADIEKKIPFSEKNSLFPMASVSKVYTATALMQLYDKEKISLNENVNKYLRSLQVPATFKNPVTLHNLLTHTSGLDELPGRRIKNVSEQRPLAVFLKANLVRFFESGVMTSYSSYGLSVGGVLIEDVSKSPFSVYLEKNIFRPLKMRRTYIQNIPTTEQKNLVSAYEAEDGKLVKIPYEIYQTPPVSSIISSLPDVANFMLMHLEKGSLNNQRIFSEKTAVLMQTQQETMHPAIPGWAYGWQVNDMNGQYIIEHGGDIGGFSSLMFLLPEKNMGVFIVHHLEGNNMRFDIKKTVLNVLFPDTRELKKPVAINDSNIQRFAGKYRANIYCHSCNDSTNIQEFEIKANTDGSISLWGAKWIQIKPLLFVSEDGKQKLGFKQDEAEKIICASAGSWKVVEKVN